MGINQKQYEQLLKPLNESRVAKRGQAGRQLSYLESWDVKAHLIRIFGFGGWSWNVITAELAFEEKGEKNWAVGYKVIGELLVPDLRCSYTEAAVGSAQLPQRGEAHDMAVKTAESDALKRAAINLGTQFGLSLYNNGSMRDVVVQTLDKEESASD
jgi:recombination DNA repair RAD52 pathway protein